MSIISNIKKELNKLRKPEKVEVLQRFFKTGPGEYAEGDKFIGVMVPQQRKVSKMFYKSIELKEIQKLLNENVHEYRLTALFMLVLKFSKAEEEAEKERYVKFYLDNLERVNNWDLVDLSAYKILGVYLLNRKKEILYELANTDHLWKQRVSVLATFYFIKNNKFNDTLKLAKILLYHPHDLIHKAVGWMLREIGKRDFDVEMKFLKKHYKKMPRTMLRYAIEKFEPTLRKKILAGKI